MDWFAEYCTRDVCGWGAVAHTAYRQLLHIATSAGLVLLALTAWSELASRGWLFKLRGYSLFLVPPLVAVFLIQGREAFDAAAGDSPLKSLIDVYLGWGAGCVLSVVGLWRLNPRIATAIETVRQQRRNMRRRRAS